MSVAWTACQWLQMKRWVARKHFWQARVSRSFYTVKKYIYFCDTSQHDCKSYPVSHSDNRGTCLSGDNHCREEPCSSKCSTWKHLGRRTSQTWREISYPPYLVRSQFQCCQSQIEHISNTVSLGNVRENREWATWRGWAMVNVEVVNFQTLSVVSTRRNVKHTMMLVWTTPSTPALPPAVLMMGIVAR